MNYIFKIEHTCGEHVIPPVRLTDVGFQIIGRFGNDDVRRADNCPNGKEHGKYWYDDAQSLDEVEIRDFDGFGWTDSKDDGNAVFKKQKTRKTDKHFAWENIITLL